MATTVDGILAEIREKTPPLNNGTSYIFRGEPLLYDKSSSSLYRAIETANKDIGEARRTAIYLRDNSPAESLSDDTLASLKSTLERTPIAITEELLNAMEQIILKVAKRYSEGVSDDILLAEIQHMGGATTLMDFTSEINVALYFASNKETPPKSYNEYNSLDEYRKASNGRVIITTTAKTPSQQVIAPDTSAAHTDAQIRSETQKSVFIRPNQGYLEIVEDNVVEIPVDLKRDLKTYLENQGITHNVIFGDIHGYIAGQTYDIYNILNRLGKSTYKHHKEFFKEMFGYLSAFYPDD